MRSLAPKHKQQQVLKSAAAAALPGAVERAPGHLVFPDSSGEDVGEEDWEDEGDWDGDWDEEEERGWEEEMRNVEEATVNQEGNRHAGGRRVGGAAVLFVAL